jgi:hypothetical protein
MDITPETKRLVSKALKCVLGGVDKLFARLRIRYSVSDGTLLGLQRNGKFIPWDDDADARVNSKDWKKLKKYAKTLSQTSDGMYTDGTLLWDGRLGTGAPDVQVTCGQSFKPTVHMDVVVAWFESFPWQDSTELVEGPLERARISGVEVSVAPKERAQKALKKVYGQSWRTPFGFGRMDQHGIWEYPSSEQQQEEEKEEEEEEGEEEKAFEDGS